MEVDVIILSYAKNDSIIKMNNDCINSLNNSTDEHIFNILLIIGIIIIIFIILILIIINGNIR